MVDYKLPNFPLKIGMGHQAGIFSIKLGMGHQACIFSSDVQKWQVQTL